MERLGVGRLSLSSGWGPPSDDLDVFLLKPGEEGGRWLVMLIALDARRSGFAGLGECAVSGEVAG
jgi:hypothetical protein